jgi:hypothetical protein
MFRNFLIIASVVPLFFSCSTEKKEEVSQQLSVAEITEKAPEYVGKTVAVSGTIVHVCKHGGKRLFMIGEDPKERFKVTAGTAIGSFDVKLEGSDAVATGIIEEQRIDEAFLNSWEVEMNTDTKPEVGHQGHQPGEKQEDHDSNQNQQIASMRKQLAESGKDHLSFYSLKCESMKEL